MVLRGGHVPNQAAALEAICVLVLRCPVLWRVFEEAGGPQYIRAVKVDKRLGTNTERDALLSSSRRALACTTETEVLTLICEHNQMRKVWWDVPRAERQRLDEERRKKADELVPYVG